MKVIKKLLIMGVCACLLTACNGKKGAAVVMIETTAQDMTTLEVETATQEAEAAEGETTTREIEAAEEETTTREIEAAEETTTREAAAAAEETTTREAEAAEEETTTREAEAAEEETTTQEAAAAEEETTTQEVAAAEEETTTQMPTMSEEERAALLRQSVQRALPGIVCWGDSLTVGYGGNGESYPATISRLISENLIDGIPVVNNGVCVEQSHTIMARAGVWPMYVHGFTIPAECSPMEIKIELQNGMYTNLTAFGDSGLNPVTIAGVKGILTSSNQENKYGYFYFSRLEPGDELVVPGMTQVYSASTDMYGGYINVIFMGENGFYQNAEDLISQYQLFIDTKGLTRYIVIGLTTGDNNSRGELSQKMSDYFGSNYIDMRTELTVRGPELVGLERTEGDWYNIENGLVMAYLMSDNIHLNEYGYRAMGMIIYERMEALGYFDEVKSAIAQYSVQ